jgi:hypothetical protein
MVFAAAATGLMAGIALPLQFSSAEAALTCREAAKLKYPDHRKARHAYKKACKAGIIGGTRPPCPEGYVLLNIGHCVRI